jgi:replicative DNA helicase
MEKQIPHNIEAERGVLGGIIIDTDAYDLVADTLQVADFYRDSHRTIYEAMAALASKRSMPDILTLSDELERLGKLEEIGGVAYLAELAGSVPTSGNLSFYSEIVMRTAVHRRLIHAAGHIAGLAYNQDENALEEAEKTLFAVASHRNTRDFSTASAIMNDCLTDLVALQNRSKKLVGVSTGFEKLDHYLGGMQRSDLLILAGRPGMGKSSLALSIAYNAVMGHSAKVAIFSLEMSKKQLMQRLLSFDSGVALYRLRNGYISDHEWEPIITATSRLSTNNLVIDDTGGITLQALRNKARRLKAKQGLDLIVVDYLQLMHADSGNRSRNREQEVAEISTGLKELAKELDIPVLALAQLSRAVENRGDKRPQLSDLRESGSIENDADLVMFAYREAYYDPNSTSSRAEVIIAKHRNGPVGTVDLAFRKETTRFEEVEQ